MAYITPSVVREQNQQLRITMIRSFCTGGPPLAIRSLQWLWQNKSALPISSTTSRATSITISNNSQNLLSGHSMQNSKCFNTITTSRCSVSKPESEASSTVVRSKTHKSMVNFCQSCGGPAKQCIPEGDEKMRAVCTLCGKVYYENPKMVVGCLVEHNNKVLLCKRKIQPSYGLWTLPAGFMELGESAADGAVRETMEEACAEVEVVSPFAQLDIPLISQSYVIFRAQFKQPYFSAGSESLECALFSLDEIPFESLAFSSIFVTLKMYVEDTKAGKFSFHYCMIDKRPGASPSDPHGFIVCQHACS